MFRPGQYAGCAWSVVAATLALIAYLGLTMFGPSNLPVLIGIVTGAVLSGVMAWALWRGRGGRNAALLSLILGTLLAGFPIASRPGSQIEATDLGASLFGVAIVLTSAYAVLSLRRPSKES